MRAGRQVFKKAPIYFNAHTDIGHRAQNTIFLNIIRVQQAPFFQGNCIEPACLESRDFYRSCLSPGLKTVTFSSHAFCVKGPDMSQRI